MGGPLTHRSTAQATGRPRPKAALAVLTSALIRRISEFRMTRRVAMTRRVTRRTQVAQSMSSSAATQTPAPTDVATPATSASRLRVPPRAAPEGRRAKSAAPVKSAMEPSAPVRRILVRMGAAAERPAYRSPGKAIRFAGMEARHALHAGAPSSAMEAELVTTRRGARCKPFLQASLLPTISAWTSIREFCQLHGL